MRIVFAAAFLAICTASTVSTINNTYCNLSCKSDHICCKYAPCNLNPKCPQNYKSYKMLDFDRKLLLDVHNIIRNQIASGHDSFLPIQAANMQVVTYSKELEFIAACWASRCTLEGEECMDSMQGPTSHIVWQATEKKILGGEGRGHLAQTLLRYYPLLQLLTPQLVANYSSSGLGLEMKTLAQLLWADARYFGCSRVSFDATLERSRTFHVVCVYFPQGQTEGNPIFKVGPPCEGCKCNRKFGALCGRVEFSLEDDVFVPPFTLGARKAAMDLRLLLLLLLVGLVLLKM